MGFYFRFWSFLGFVVLHYSFPSTLSKPYSFVSPEKLTKLLNIWLESQKKVSSTVLEVKDSINIRKDYISMMRKKKKTN